MLTSPQEEQVRRILSEGHLEDLLCFKNESDGKGCLLRREIAQFVQQAWYADDDLPAFDVVAYGCPEWHRLQSAGDNLMASELLLARLKSLPRPLASTFSGVPVSLEHVDAAIALAEEARARGLLTPFVRSLQYLDEASRTHDMFPAVREHNWHHLKRLVQMFEAWVSTADAATSVIPNFDDIANRLRKRVSKEDTPYPRPPGAKPANPLYAKPG